MLVQRARASGNWELIRQGLWGGILGMGLSALVAVGLIRVMAPPDSATARRTRVAAAWPESAAAFEDAGQAPEGATRRRSVRLPGRGGDRAQGEASSDAAKGSTRRVRTDGAEAVATSASAPTRASEECVAGDAAIAADSQSDAAKHEDEAHGASSEFSTTDPDLLLLRQLGVDLDHPDAELRRLAAEYRAGLLALESRSAGVDRARLALLDRGMTALLRVKPSATGTAFALFAEESQRAPDRYFALLLRGGDRGPVEPALAEIAFRDPDPARRASAVMALGPVPGIDSLPVILNALLDPVLEVRAAAAAVIAEAALVQPAMMSESGVRASLQSALDAERDPGVRIALTQMLGPP